MVEIRRGCTRWVFLTARWAIKVPCLNSWPLFLRGLLGNLQESGWWKMTRDARLCPVRMACPVGLWLVMPIAVDIRTDELPDINTLRGLPLDYKTENFGRMANSVVMIDYGS